MTTTPATTPDSAFRSLYAGIFQEEVCIQFLGMCDTQIYASFFGVYTQCMKKTNSQDLFVQCLDQVASWGEPIFAEELKCFVSMNNDIDEIFRATFVTFVKMMYVRPGAPRMHIRLTVPPLSFFIRHFIIESSKHLFIRSGAYFDNKCSSLDKKDAVMDILRASLRICNAEYVIAQETHGDATIPTSPTLDHEPQVSPWESASNVGISDDSNQSSKSKISRKLKASDIETKQLPLVPVHTESDRGKAHSHTSESDKSKANSHASASSFKVRLSSELAKKSHVSQKSGRA